MAEGSDLSAAIPNGVTGCMLNSGQTCSGLTRMLVPEARVDEARRIAVEAAGWFAPGDPSDPETMLGPLVNARQRERVVSYIDGAVARRCSARSW